MITDRNRPEHHAKVVFRVNMVDPRAWEEQGLLIPIGPNEDGEQWLDFMAAEGYQPEHITDDLADSISALDEGEPQYTDVIALVAPNPQLPLLYYLVTRPVWDELSRRRAAGPPVDQ